MRNIKYYLDEIVKEKQNLTNSLSGVCIDASNQEGLGAIVKKASQQILANPSVQKTTFITSKKTIQLSVCGTGYLIIKCNNEVLFSANISKDTTEFLLDNPSGQESVYILAIDGELDVLDLHDNEITKFLLGHNDKINRILLYNNQLTALTCSKNSHLQFLHIFNNPICDNEEYELPLEMALDSLADRTDKAIGSVVFYPWYGLERLIQKNAQTNEWEKYPCAHATLSFQEGALYGVVDQGEIIYYRYASEELYEHTAMNRHHTLRKRFERDITLKKNWMFGSAILYSDEADKFCYYLRETGVQDVWETAEKGFGLCIGTTDFHSGRIADWEDLNLKGYLSRGNTPTSPWDDKKYWDTETSKTVSRGTSAQHGDFCLSQMVGRGGEGIFGFAPNAKCFLINFFEYVTPDLVEEAVEVLCKNCQVIANSLVDTPDIDYDWKRMIRRSYGVFGETNPLFVSSGNWGYGTQWDYARQTGFLYYANYGTENNLTSLENSSNVIYVASLTPDKKVSSYSGNSNVIDKTPYYTDFTPNNDYITHYGEVLGWRDDLIKLDSEQRFIGGIGYSQGTSMSCPNCGGTFTLMRKIYSKLHPEETNYGKHSPFMEYVKTHWMDSLPHLTSFSVGMGLPSFLASPTKPHKGAIKFSGNITLDSVEVGKSFCAIDIARKGGKPGCSYDFDHNYFAEIEDGVFVPLRAFSEGKSLTAYTRDFLQNPSNEEKAENYNKANVVIPSCKAKASNVLADDLGAVSSTENFVCGGNVQEGDYFTFSNTPQKTFTLQFVVDVKTVLEAAPKSFDEEGKPKVGQQKILLVNVPSEKEYLYLAVGAIGAYLPEGKTQVDDIEPIIQYGPGSGKTTSFRLLSSATFGERKFPSTIGGCSNILHLKENDQAVITLVLNEAELLGYYNGNRIFRLPLEYVNVALDGFALKQNMVKDANQDNVRIYNRILSQEEIIQNSIALLQQQEG